MKEDYTRKEWDAMIKSIHSGQETRINEMIYWHFLECMPPIYSKKGGFLLLEASNHNQKGEALRMWFYKKPEGYFAQLVNETEHVRRSDLIAAGLM